MPSKEVVQTFTLFLDLTNKNDSPPLRDLGDMLSKALKGRAENDSVIKTHKDKALEHCIKIMFFAFFECSSRVIDSKMESPRTDRCARTLQRFV